MCICIHIYVCLYIHKYDFYCPNDLSIYVILMVFRYALCAFVLTSTVVINNIKFNGDGSLQFGIGGTDGIIIFFYSRNYRFA